MYAYYKLQLSFFNLLCGCRRLYLLNSKKIQFHKPYYSMLANKESTCILVIG